jgi:UDP-N-acetylmuramyl pentapeptide synthase
VPGVHFGLNAFDALEHNAENMVRSVLLAEHVHLSLDDIASKVEVLTYGEVDLDV